MVDGKKDILAVQTLRNMVMSSTLLASTSITLVVLIVNLLVSNNAISALDSLRIIGAHNSKMLVYKSFILILFFMFSFINFATSIRYITHLAFLINVTPFDEDCSKEYCAKNLVNGANHHTWGLRTFYFSLTIILWFFDPLFLLIGTLVILYWLYLGDVSQHIIPKKEKLKSNQHQQGSSSSSSSSIEKYEIPLHEISK
ncbi:DUF599 family protein [Tieghemostelium lacteum]|uniref:DUF599 family protein n=1 Tax=Tieghemostelium lacteum TaxID=361077 RepID=A0A152A6L1_TIELA|nr:DUF599 family protein [Tieghemostelium lacteum]|eukprot:KYR01755.1 DUF599 family protein [Tieghemostelium lacteum]